MFLINAASLYYALFTVNDLYHSFNSETSNCISWLTNKSIVLAKLIISLSSCRPEAPRTGGRLLLLNVCVIIYKYYYRDSSHEYIIYIIYIHEKNCCPLLYKLEQKGNKQLE